MNIDEHFGAAANFTTTRFSAQSWLIDNLCNDVETARSDFKSYAARHGLNADDIKKALEWPGMRWKDINAQAYVCRLHETQIEKLKTLMHTCVQNRGTKRIIECENMGVQDMYEVHIGRNTTMEDETANDLTALLKEWWVDGAIRLDAFQENGSGSSLSPIEKHHIKSDMMIDNLMIRKTNPECVGYVPNMHFDGDVEPVPFFRHELSSLTSNISDYLCCSICDDEIKDSTGTAILVGVQLPVLQCWRDDALTETHPNPSVEMCARHIDWIFTKILTGLYNWDHQQFETINLPNNCIFNLNGVFHSSPTRETCNRYFARVGLRANPTSTNLTDAAYSHDVRLRATQLGTSNFHLRRQAFSTLEKFRKWQGDLHTAQTQLSRMSSVLNNMINEINLDLDNYADVQDFWVTRSDL